MEVLKIVIGNKLNDKRYYMYRTGFSQRIVGVTILRDAVMEGTNYIATRKDS